MPQIDLNGTSIHFTDTGSGEETIVFSHGLLMSGAMFERQIHHFQGSCRCITFDHRGQGQSGVPEDGYDMDTLSADAAALIEHLGVSPVHFVGLSMGGFVGMRLAAHRPAILKTLTLLNTSADPEAPENGPKYRMLNLVARWVGLWAVVGRVMPILFGKTFLNDTMRAEERRRWASAISGNNRVGITRAVAGVIAREGCSELLGAIRTPVGIGVGDEDFATKPAQSDRIQTAIEGSELMLFQGVGHSSSIEAPVLVNQLIERTIARSRI
ncbi:MAG: alpha/beta hydrolase [Paracoccaceae bacterium]|nr:alpha/beta hydrolase [Paracoccaceae bacterium]